MFEQMKNAAKLASVMKDLPRLKARMEEVRADLAGRHVEGQSGGGAVVAVATGKMQIHEIRLSPALISGAASLDTTAREYAERLVVEAVNAALEKAQQMIAAEIHKTAVEMDLPIPEGALAGLLGSS